MWKRVGLLALLVSAAGSAILPTAAFAQNGYYGGYYDGGSRNWDRHERREWRERERAERRAQEWRERQWRQQMWRDRQWRRQERWDRQWDRRYQPDPYFYFGYGR